MKSKHYHFKTEHMATLIKAVLTFDDGTTQEFDAAQAVAAIADVSVQVSKSDGSTETFVPQQ